MAFYRHVRADTNGFKTNDVIEDWRHWRRSVACSPWLDARRILFIAYLESPLFRIIQWLSITQQKCQPMSHKKIPCAVCWKASKTSKLWYTSGGH